MMKSLENRNLEVKSALESFFSKRLKARWSSVKNVVLSIRKDFGVDIILHHSMLKSRHTCPLTDNSLTAIFTKSFEDLAKKMQAKVNAGKMFVYWETCIFGPGDSIEQVLIEYDLEHCSRSLEV